MSFFGRNIKKIRSAKKISQSAFADLFKLKRGSIGAYEEGRAEAKIDTVIEIANYFKLSLDQLLKKELTINEIYHLNELTKKIEQSQKTSSTQVNIPLISRGNQNDFIRNFEDINYLSGLQSIMIPGVRPNSFAFEYTGNSLLTDHSGIVEGDIFIAEQFKVTNLSDVANNQLFVFLISNDLLFGRIVSVMPQIQISFDNPTFEDIFIEKSEIKQVWRVYKIITSTITVDENVRERLKIIEQKLDRLYNSKES